MSTLSNFHGMFDTNLVRLAGHGVATAGQQQTVSVTTRQRKLHYRFSPHFHPYVEQLLQKLIHKGIAGLQAADTEYLTTARLDVATAARSQKGEAVTLKAGEHVVLADGTVIKLADGTMARLSFSKVIRLPDGKALSISAAAPVTLPQETRAWRAGERLRQAEATFTCNTDTPATLPEGGPRAALFEDFFQATYQPVAAAQDTTATSGVFVEVPYPVKELDFSSRGAYSDVNWELFCHVNRLIGSHLSAAGLYDEARRWFRYNLDCTANSGGSAPERFWGVKPFQTTEDRSVEELLINLSTGTDPELKQQTIDSIQAWKDAPFRPHVVARYRPSAYMRAVWMDDVDNEIAQCDAQFRTDSPEGVDKALQGYIYLANRLGPRPQVIPKQGSVRPQTYNNLRGDLDAFGNALRDIECDIPFDLAPLPAPSTEPAQFSMLQSVAKSLYFCVPRNQKLLAYWDIVEDRLFKIRNSLNFQGVFRRLPLFLPPYDPRLLASAAAAGVDVAAIVSGAYQSTPMLKFDFLIEQATQMCTHLISLCDKYSAAKKELDGEALTLLRARHEQTILEESKFVKYCQWQEAIKGREALERSLEGAQQRHIYYERLLGRDEEEIRRSLPSIDPLDEAGLESETFEQSDPTLAPRAIPVNLATSARTTLNIASQTVSTARVDVGALQMSSYEVAEIALLDTAQLAEDTAAAMEVGSSALGLIPQFDAKGQPLGVGVAFGFGGVQLSTAARMLAQGTRGIADRISYEAGKVAKLGAYALREQGYAAESARAAAEINAFFPQLRAAQIKEAYTAHEHRLQEKHIAQSAEYFAFLKGEMTAIDRDTRYRRGVTLPYLSVIYRELEKMVSQCADQVVDVARIAQRALQNELGEPELRLLRPSYLSSGPERLLAGEKLMLDLQRLRLAHRERKRQQYELVKNVSLLQLDPLALIQFRSTGRCTFKVPEEIFDLDTPGHYRRRIQSVALTIPCITGPYVGVHCRLTLVGSSIREVSTLSPDGVYERQGPEDVRFRDVPAGFQAIVTSSAQNDSGMFEPDERDPWQLRPFQFAGGISEWELQCLGEFSQFDRDTMVDVIAHFRLTAEEGGETLARAASKHLRELVEQGTAPGSVRLFSLRHEFPSVWAKFKASPPQTVTELTLDFREQHFSFWSKDHLDLLHRTEIFSRQKVDIHYQPAGPIKATLEPDPTFGKVLRARLPEVRLQQADGTLAEKPTGRMSLFVSDNSINDLLLAMTWKKEV